MGLISRVSSRTYRSYHINHQKWALTETHGTSDERPVAESHKCTRSESLSSVDQLPTPRSSQSEFTSSEPWATTPSSALSDWTTVTLAGPARVSLDRPGSSMSCTTPLLTSWCELRLSSRAPSSPSMPPHSDLSTSLTTPRLSAERRTTPSPKRRRPPSRKSITADQKPKRSTPSDRRPLMSLPT